MLLTTGVTWRDCSFKISMPLEIHKKRIRTTAKKIEAKKIENDPKPWETILNVILLLLPSRIVQILRKIIGLKEFLFHSIDNKVFDC